MIDDLVALIDQLNEKMAHVDPLLDGLTTTAVNVAKISAKIDKQSKDLPEVTRSLLKLLVSMRTVMEDLSRMTPLLPRIAENVSDATNNVPVLMLQTQQVMTELEQLIKQLQSSWLLGGKTGAKPASSARISPLEVRP